MITRPLTSKGKRGAVLSWNEPVPTIPDFFKGKAHEYYGRWTYKL